MQIGKINNIDVLNDLSTNKFYRARKSERIISGRSVAILTARRCVTRKYLRYVLSQPDILIARYIINSRLIAASPDSRCAIGDAARAPVLFIYLRCDLIYNRYTRRPSALRNRCREHAAAVYHYARKRGSRERETEREEQNHKGASPPPRCFGIHAIKHSALSSVLAFVACLRF